LGSLKSGGSLLHVGCAGDPLPEWLGNFRETRLDIDPAMSPDIVASMVDMGEIGQYEAVLCIHALEHLYSHEVPRALGEFYRVLKPGGFLMVFVPDLQDAKATDEVLFDSPAGPITGMDLIYGYRVATTHNPHMQHKTGFVAETLSAAIGKAGFAKTKVSRLANFDMMGVGVK